MKRIAIPILGLTLAGGLITASLAASDQLYVCNQLYKGRIDKAAGPSWVSVDDFSKAASLSLQVGTLDHGRVPVVYGGRKFSIPAEARPDGTYIDGRVLVEDLGGSWVFNSSLGLTNVSIPTFTVGAADAASTASPSAAPSQLPGPSTKSPIRVVKFSYVDPTLPLGSKNSAAAALTTVTGSVVAENTGDSYVDGVEMILHIQDGYGNDLDTQKNEVNKMDPGKSVTWDWQWTNSSNMIIHPVIEIQHNPYYSKADRDAFAKSKTSPPAGKKVSIRSGPTEGVPAGSATVGGAAGGYSTTAPNASSSAYEAPTQSSNPPGFNAGGDNNGSGSSTASATSTNPPGF